MNRRTIILSILATTFAFPSNAVYGAMLSVVPDVTTVAAGDTFGATIYVDSAGTPINASDGTLAFSPDFLKAQSVIFNTSIFTLWTQAPSIDNSNGTVTWSGGSIEGFSGNRGQILRVVFVAKKTGAVALLLPSSNVYANDGLGTNVATAPNTSSITVVTAPAPTPSKPAVPTPSTTSGDKKSVPTSTEEPSKSVGFIGWVGSFSSGDWALAVALLLSLVSIGINIAPWIRLRIRGHHHRGRSLTLRKTRSPAPRNHRKL